MPVNAELPIRRYFLRSAKNVVRSLDEFGPLLRRAGEEYFLVTSGRVAVHTEATPLGDDELPP